MLYAIPNSKLTIDFSDTTADADGRLRHEDARLSYDAQLDFENFRLVLSGTAVYTMETTSPARPDDQSVPADAVEAFSKIYLPLSLQKPSFGSALKARHEFNRKFWWHLRLDSAQAFSSRLSEEQHINSLSTAYAAIFDDAKIIASLPTTTDKKLEIFQNELLREFVCDSTLYKAVLMCLEIGELTPENAAKILRSATASIAASSVTKRL